MVVGTDGKGARLPCGQSGVLIKSKVVSIWDFNFGCYPANLTLLSRGHPKCWIWGNRIRSGLAPAMIDQTDRNMRG